MPISGFNVGKEVSLDLVSPRLGVINFGLLTSFTARPLKTRLQSLPITNGGRPVYKIVYHGWEGSFEIDRADGTLDALSQILEDNYFGGQPETYFMLTETIRNPDTSIDEFRFKNVVIEMDDHGTWRGEEKVQQRFTFAASYREKV